MLYIGYNITTPNIPDLRQYNEIFTDYTYDMCLVKVPMGDKMYCEYCTCTYVGPSTRAHRSKVSMQPTLNAFGNGLFRP